MIIDATFGGRSGAVEAGGVMAPPSNVDLRRMPYRVH